MTNGIFCSSVVAGFADRLIAVGEAPAQDEAKRHLSEFLDNAAESDQQFDAVFLAALMVRDLGRIGSEEAACVFERLCSARDTRWHRRSQNVLAHYRAHGEAGIADMIEDRPERYGELLADGRASLMLRETGEQEPEVADWPAAIGTLCERALELTASVAGHTPSRGANAEA